MILILKCDKSIECENVSLDSGYFFFSPPPPIFAREMFTKRCLNLCFTSSKTYLRLNIVVLGFSQKTLPLWQNFLFFRLQLG